MSGRQWHCSSLYGKLGKTQSAFTCSKSTMETPEQYVKSVNNRTTEQRQG